MVIVYLFFQNGTLKIIDRKRHIFKLSQGEYIVPEKIETIYHKSPYVNQVFVHGESIKVIKILQYTKRVLILNFPFSNRYCS